MPASIQTFALPGAPAAVFNAWTRADDVMAWWREPDEFVVCAWEADLRPGGRWRVTFAAPDGQTFGAGGEYLVVDGPSILAFTWDPDWDDAAPIPVRFDIRPGGAGSSVTVTHGPYEDLETEAENAEAWRRAMALLAAWLEAGAAPSPA